MNPFNLLFRNTKNKKNALKESEERFRMLVDSFPNAIIVNDKGRLVYMNPAAVGLLGLTYPIKIEKNSLYDFVREDFHPSLAKHMQSLLYGVSKTELSEVKFIRATGEYIDIEIASALVHYDGKEMVQSVIKDVTQHKSAKEHVQYLSMYDSLTGLYNNFYLDKQIQKFSGRREFNGRVIMIDIHQLKKINDTKGHPVGDKFIKSVAKLVASEFREEDVVARIGGDEFCVLLPNISRNKIPAIVKRLKQKISNIKIAEIKNPSLNISIGTAYAKSGKDLNKALKIAEAEMHKHKENKQI